MNDEIAYFTVRWKTTELVLSTACSQLFSGGPTEWLDWTRIIRVFWTDLVAADRCMMMLNNRIDAQRTRTVRCWYRTRWLKTVCRLPLDLSRDLQLKLKVTSISSSSHAATMMLTLYCGATDYTTKFLLHNNRCEGVYASISVCLFVCLFVSVS